VVDDGRHAEDLIRPGEAARMLQISIQRLHMLVEEGYIKPAERWPSGYRRYDRAEIERFRKTLEVA
jgi:DNA-binding transcriptional MerR regulator